MNRRLSFFILLRWSQACPKESILHGKEVLLYDKDGSAENPPKNELDLLFQFLQQEVEREEQRQLVKESFSSKEAVTVSTFPNKKIESKKGKIPSTVDGLFNGQTKTVSCVFCDKSHESKDCKATEFWSLDESKKKVQEKRVCFYCLKSNHTARTCKTFVKWIMCPDVKTKKNTKEGASRFISWK